MGSVIGKLWGWYKCYPPRSSGRVNWSWGDSEGARLCSGRSFMLLCRKQEELEHIEKSLQLTTFLDFVHLLHPDFGSGGLVIY